MPDTIPVFKTNNHQRKKFDCGSHALNDFLRRHAESNHLNGFGNTFVLVLNEEIVGFYTVSMNSTIEFQHITQNNTVPFPKYPIPVALIGRLAVSRNRQGQGWGKWLIGDALHKIVQASENIAGYAVMVEAKDEKAKAFYQQYGFISFPNKPLSLYISMKSIVSLVNNSAVSVAMKD